MLRLFHVAAVGAAVALSGGCNSGSGRSGTAAAPAELSAADLDGIRAADSAFVAAANAGDVDAIVAVYASDAALLPPNLPPQKGQGAIRGFWGGFLKAYTVKFELQSDTIEGRGDLAYNMGQYRFSAVPKAKNQPGVADEGKFLEVLKRQPDGKWRYVADMYSSNLAPQR